MNQPISASRSRPASPLLALLGFVVGFGCAGAVAAAGQTALAGGPGGSPFVDRPQADARIGAVRFGSGAWIDSVTVVYITADGRRLPSQLHGGPGGGPCVITLEPGERILALAGRHGQYVQAVWLITTKGVSRTCGDPTGGREFRIDVPAGQDAVGMAGRAGVYLDAIGLAFGAPTTSAAPRPPPAPGATGPATLVGDVRVKPDLHSARLDIRLSAPGTVQVNLGQRRLRPKECFAPSDRLVSGSPQHAPSPQHRVDFQRLEMNTTYSYAVRIDNGRCESGSFTTSTRLD